jgi:hypothetical protein
MTRRRYHAHPPLHQETDMTPPVQGPAYYFPSIEKKYGRPINEWIGLIRSCKLTKHKELVDWLKTEYGIGHGHATALVGYALAGHSTWQPADHGPS